MTEPTKPGPEVGRTPAEPTEGTGKDPASALATTPTPQAMKAAESMEDVINDCVVELSDRDFSTLKADIVR